MSKQFQILVMDEELHKEFPFEADSLSEAFQRISTSTNINTASFIFDTVNKLQYKILQAQSFEGEPWKK